MKIFNLFIHTTPIGYRTILITAIASILLICCKNDYETVFEKPAHERMREAMEDYRSQLVAAPDGWKAVIQTGTGGGYFFYFDFHEDGTVTMISDFSQTTSNEPIDGTFAVLPLQRPTLTFDTYSYIHLLTDPDASVNGGEYGEGLQSDFEFALEESAGDTLKLIGIKENTETYFIKATASEREALLEDKVITQSISQAINHFQENNYSYIESEAGDTIAMGMNHETKTFSVFYKNSNLEIEHVKVPCFYSMNGISLSESISLPELTFDALLWDNNTSNYYLPNGDSKIYLQNSTSFISFRNALPNLVETLGNKYRTIIIDPEVMNNNSTEFIDIYEEAAQNVEIDMSDYGLTLGEVFLEFNPLGEATINYILYQDNTGYLAIYDYTYSTNSDNSLTLNFSGMNGNADLADNSLQPLVNYFEDQPLMMDYYCDPNEGTLLSRVYPKGTPITYFYGMLE